MSNTDSKLYKYTIPLETVDGIDKPTYSPTGSKEIYLSKVSGNEHIVVQDEPIPHFHKDSVRVSIEKVNKDEYR